LRGKSVALAFFENSTRTRISFGTAASRLGADTMNLQAEASSLKKGESLLDTVHTLDAMKPDCLVMRHASSGARISSRSIWRSRSLMRVTARMNILRRVCSML